MASYLIYLIAPTGRVGMGDSQEHPDDEAALAWFDRMDDVAGDAELWCGGRLVARRASGAGSTEV